MHSMPHADATINAVDNQMHTGIFLCHIFLDICNYTKLITTLSAIYESAIPVQELNLLRGRREQAQSAKHEEVKYEDLLMCGYLS